MTKIKKCYTGHDLDNIDLHKGESYHHGVENINKILSGDDYPDDIYTDYEDDEEEYKEEEIGCIDCKSDPDYIYCGKNLPHLNVRKGDSFESVFESIDAKVQDVIAHAESTVILKNSLGKVILTEDIDPGTTEEIIAPDGNLNIKNSIGSIITSVQIPSGEASTVIAPNAQYKLNNSLGQTQEQDIIPAGESKIIVAEDAHYDLKNTSGTSLQTGDIPSDNTKTITAPDSTYSLKNSLGVQQDSGSIVSGGNKNLTAQDGTVIIINSDEDTLDTVIVASGATSTLKVGGWVRPKEWMKLPKPNENEVYFLMAVFESGANQIATGITTSVANSAKVEFFNGTSATPFATYTTGFTNMSVNWSDCLPSSFFANRHYRQCIMKISVTSGTLQGFNMGMSHTTYGTARRINLLDAHVHMSNFTVTHRFGYSQQLAYMLENVTYYGTHSSLNIDGAYTNTTRLEKVEFKNPTTATGSLNSTFFNTGLRRAPINLTISSITSISEAFRTSRSEIIELDLTGVTTVGNTFTGATPIEIIFYNCGGITSSISTFALPSLSKLLLFNYKLSFTIATSSILTQQAQLDLVNSLASLVGSPAQNITMTGLPQYSAVVSVANAKNWNIIT